VHDALLSNQEDSIQRITILLNSTEGDGGTLYVANDGQPFTDSNFKAISNLGQNDKDPQKSIGNKKIGFRNVLEISKAPEIYSRVSRSSSTYDGYCFRFDPHVTDIFIQPILSLFSDDRQVLAPIGDRTNLVNWGEEMLISLREISIQVDEPWLSGELAYLSPYALPLPVETGLMQRIIEFEKSGFSTVIRLPLVNKSILEKVE